MLNDWFRKQMGMERRKIARGLANPVTEDQLDRLVTMLTECRDIIGAMPLSSKGAALHTSVYQALCIAKDFRTPVTSEEG